MEPSKGVERGTPVEVLSPCYRGGGPNEILRLFRRSFRGLSLRAGALHSDVGGLGTGRRRDQQCKGHFCPAGHSLYTLTAFSDNPNEPILGFDFSGDPDNNDPATGLGFFGPMSQVNPLAPEFSTVFQNNNALFVAANPPRQVNEDSQFLFSTTDASVVASTPASQEGANILQATFAFTDPKGMSVPFVQLVIPDAATGSIGYRGDVLVGQSGQGVNWRVQGGIFDRPPFDPPPLVADVFDNTNFLGEIINLQPVNSIPGTPPVTWSELSGPTYTPNFGALPNSPGLGPATWTWNPATQAFQFKTLGASAGTYVWQGSVSNIFGSDTFSIAVDVIIPEPATLSLITLTLVSALGCSSRRRRSREAG